MTEEISCKDWLSYLGREYLDEYVRAGGASVKFAVVKESRSISSVCAQVRNLAMEKGFVPITVNAAETKVHMIDNVFFACAAQVPWAKLTDFVLKRFADDAGFYVPTGAPAGRSFAGLVAAQSGLEVDFVRRCLAQDIREQVLKDRAMIRDFRLAMWSLCQGRLTGAPSMESDSALLEQWLTGRINKIACMRPLAIFTKINRANARLHLASLLHWLRVAHIPGTILIMNADRLLETGRGGDGEHYSRAALLDAYEMMRQFIDSADDLEGLLLVVVANEAILDPDSRQRGLAAYQALRNRVYDEVRARLHANPAGSLVRLATEGVR